jgi:Rieske Fe-S protein
MTLSETNAEASQLAAHRVASAYDKPETADEITRRTFMANATVTIGGIVGLVLAIPIVGSLLPPKSSSTGSWSPLSPQEFDALQSATSKPVKLTFTLKFVDGYLPEQSVPEYCWGIKVDPAKFTAARPDIFNQPGGKADVPYEVVNMGFVVFSPICPHLGCYYNWSDAQNRFMCPCHGSQYSFDGTHLAGPAPRGLDPLPLRPQSGAAEVTWIIYQSNTPQRIVVSYQA